MKYREMTLWILLLAVIDQLIKIIIYCYFFDVQFTIIPPVFYFEPVFNYLHTYAANLLQINAGQWPNIILKAAVLLVVLLGTDYVRWIANYKLLDWGLLFIISGCVCSLTDTVFWNKCLDYIYLKPLFVFDLKDMYLNIGAVLFVLSLYKNREELKSVKKFPEYIKWRFKKVES